mgnify:CR=1 FL=1
MISKDRAELVSSTECKTHYKMYKAGKRWLYAGILTCSITAGAMLGQHAVAASTDDNITVTKTVTAAGHDDNQPQLGANQTTVASARPVAAAAARTVVPKGDATPQQSTSNQGSASEAKDSSVTVNQPTTTQPAADSQSKAPAKFSVAQQATTSKQANQQTIKQVTAIGNAPKILAAQNDAEAVKIEAAQNAVEVTNDDPQSDDNQDDQGDTVYYFVQNGRLYYWVDRSNDNQSDQQNQSSRDANYDDSRRQDSEYDNHSSYIDRLIAAYNQQQRQEEQQRQQRLEQQQRQRKQRKQQQRYSMTLDELIAYLFEPEDDDDSGDVDSDGGDQTDPNQTTNPDDDTDTLPATTRVSVNYVDDNNQPIPGAKKGSVLVKVGDSFSIGANTDQLNNVFAPDDFPGYTFLKAANSADGKSTIKPTSEDSANVMTLTYVKNATVTQNLYGEDSVITAQSSLNKLLHSSSKRDTPAVGQAQKNLKTAVNEAIAARQAALLKGDSVSTSPVTSYSDAMTAVTDAVNQYNSAVAAANAGNAQTTDILRAIDGMTTAQTTNGMVNDAFVSAKTDDYKDEQSLADANAAMVAALNANYTDVPAVTNAINDYQTRVQDMKWQRRQAIVAGKEAQDSAQTNGVADSALVKAAITSYQQAVKPDESVASVTTAPIASSVENLNNAISAVIAAQKAMTGKDYLATEGEYALLKSKLQDALDAKDATPQSVTAATDTFTQQTNTLNAQRIVGLIDGYNDVQAAKAPLTALPNDLKISIEKAIQQYNQMAGEFGAHTKSMADLKGAEAQMQSAVNNTNAVQKVLAFKTPDDIANEQAVQDAQTTLKTVLTNDYMADATVAAASANYQTTVQAVQDARNLANKAWTDTLASAANVSSNPVVSQVINQKSSAKSTQDILNSTRALQFAVKTVAVGQKDLDNTLPLNAEDGIAAKRAAITNATTLDQLEHSMDDLANSVGQLQYDRAAALGHGDSRRQVIDAYQPALPDTFGGPVKDATKHYDDTVNSAKTGQATTAQIVAATHKLDAAMSSTRVVEEAVLDPKLHTVENETEVINAKVNC